MEYSVSFIKNLQKISDTSDNTDIDVAIKDYIIDTGGMHTITLTHNIEVFPNLISKYKIFPGLIAKYKNKYYSVLDRNLKEDCFYKDDVTIEVNTNSLSFNEIKYFNSNDLLYGLSTYIPRPENNLNNFPVLSEVKQGGLIYDVFKLPWDVPAILSGGVDFTKYFNPASEDDTYIKLNFQGRQHFDRLNNVNKNFFGFNDATYSNEKYSSFLLLGINTVKPDENIDQYGIILTLWRKWITILRLTFDNAPWDEYLSHIIRERITSTYKNCKSFKQFVELVIKKWDADTTTGNKIIDLTDIFPEAGILYFTQDEMKTIKDTIKFVSSNIVITEENISTKIRKQCLKNTKNDIKIYIKDKCIEPKILATFDKEDTLYAFNGNINYDETHIEKVYISNFGDVSEKLITDVSRLELYLLTKTRTTSNDQRQNIIPSNSLYLSYSLCSNFETYDIGVLAKAINYDVISLINNNKLYTYRKLELGDDLEIPVYQLDRVSAIGQNSEEISKRLDALLETEEYITPSEYYNNFTDIGAYSDGDDGFVRVKTDSNETGVPSWFWSDTLKNWCTYKNVTLRNTIKLYVWNGKNGWDEFEDILRSPDDYLYDITHLKFGIDFSTTYKYQNLNIVYKSVILTYDNNFSQYTNDTFQTVRIGKMWSKGLGNDTRRYPFSIGMPPVMRLASGEMALMYFLTLPGVNKDHPLIYPEHVKFINDVCKKYFTAGDDKTMKDDWKRVEKLKAESDSASVIISMNESTLVDADEINTVEDKALTTALSFVPFKQYIETDNLDTESYVERWS